MPANFSSMQIAGGPMNPDRREDPQLADLSKQLREDDPRLAAKLGGRGGGWVARHLLYAFAITLAGFALLAFARTPVGISAIWFGVILIFIGGYDLALRIMQLRSLIRRQRFR